MTTIAAMLALSVAFAYLWRVFDLQFTVHPTSFVAQHVLSGAACVYSAYSLWSGGWGVLEILAPITSFLYLIRSHETYVIEKTRPAPLDGPIFRLFH